jgi:hypothetical protein
MHHTPPHMALNYEIVKYSTDFPIDLLLHACNRDNYRSQWPRVLRRRSAAAWLLESLVRILLRAWIYVSCVYILCCPV